MRLDLLVLRGLWVRLDLLVRKVLRVRLDLLVLRGLWVRRVLLVRKVL